MAVMLFSAGAGAIVDVEVSGEDEALAFQSMVELFESGTDEYPQGGERDNRSVPRA